MASKCSQIIFKTECSKYDIHKPRIKNILTNCVAVKSKKFICQSGTAFHSIIRKHYGIMSGPFSSSYIRQYSTDKLRFKLENKGNAIELTNTPIKDLRSKCKKFGYGSKILFNFGKEASLNTCSLLNNRNQKTSSRSYHIYKTEDILKKRQLINEQNTSVVLYKSPENKVCFYKYYHDWKMPDYSEYRLPQTADPCEQSKKGDATKKLPTYALYALYGLCFAYGTKAHGTQYILYLATSAEVLALARIEINLTEIAEGRSVTFKWRGKPLFIRHRTPEQIEMAKNTDLATLRHPEKDEDRCKIPEWLVVIGVCTHLGCVPIADAGDWPGGYYCPCHGSHFDVSGRIMKGPAPTNLEIPEHSFDGDTLTVG